MNASMTRSKVPILGKDQIEQLAIDFIGGIDESLLVKGMPIPIEGIIEKHLGLDLDYKVIDEDEIILGCIVFNNGQTTVFDPEINKYKNIKVSKGTIIIDERLAIDKAKVGRFRFTCAHEVAHWLLHKEIYEIDEAQGVLFREDIESQPLRCLNRHIENLFQSSVTEKWDEDDWIEWQADFMAAAILMPLPAFKLEFANCLKKCEIHQEYLYVDDQFCNIANFKFITSQLSNIFQASRKAVEVRLEKLRLIERGGRRNDLVQLFER